MYQVLRIANDVVVVLHRALQFAWRIRRHKQEAPSLPRDLDRHSRLQHLIEKLVEVLSQLRSSDKHAPIVRTNVGTYDRLAAKAFGSIGRAQSCWAVIAAD